MTPKIYPASLFVTLVLALALTGCNSQNKDQERSPKFVKTTQIELHSQEIHKKYPARVKASSDIRLAFRVAGPIQNVLVEEGDFVERGELLMQLDPRDYRTQLKATEAKFREVKAEAERIMALYDKGKVSDNEHDKAVSGLKQIKAKYEAHKNELADTRLTAPFAGYVTETLFKAHETVDAGMPVVSIIDTTRLEITTHLPAGDYLARDEFQNFYCTTAENPGKKWPLELKNIVPQANMNGLYTARFKLQSPEKNQIVPGMSAEINISFKQDQAQLFEVPSSSVFEQNQKSHIWVLKPSSNTVSAHEVEIVRIHTSGNTIIKGDISPGASIVSAGVHALTEGQKVAEMEAPSETNPGNIL